MRILMDPTPAEGGNGAPAPEPAPVQTPAPAPAPGITLTPDQYRAFLDARAELDQVKADKQRAEDEREAARLEKLAADGKSKEALDALRQAKDAELASERAARSTLESEILGGRLDAAVTGAVADTTFVSLDAAAQVRDLLSARLESVREGGSVVVREKGTHRPAAEAVKAWLASDAAAHFLKAATNGGAGSRGGNVPAPAAPPDKPMTASEILLRHERERLALGRVNAGNRGLARN